MDLLHLAGPGHERMEKQLLVHLRNTRINNSVRTPALNNSAEDSIP